MFEADSELTASEILDKKTQPEQLAKLVQSLMARPLRDTRTNGSSAPKQTNHSGGVTEMDDDIPW